MKTIKLLLYGLSIIVLSTVLLFNSCGGSGNAPLSDPLVGLSITGDAAHFRQVVVTVEKIQILNTGTGAFCDVLSVPINIDLADLAKIMQLSNITGCGEGAYDTINIELDRSVQLMTASSGTTTRTVSLCSFASYRDEEKRTRALQCSGPLCALEISAAVNVLAKQDNRLALDFNIKDSDVVNPDDPSTCALTVNVSHLDETEMNTLAYPEAIIGLVSELTVTNRTFNLVRGALSLTVDYSAIPAEQQPGLDDLLQLALNDSLRVKVVSPKIGMANATINASAVFVKIEGISPNLNTMLSPLMLTFGAGGSAETIPINFKDADLSGMPADNGWVIVRLYGSDGTNYLASRIIVEPSGMSGDG